MELPSGNISGTHGTIIAEYRQGEEHVFERLRQFVTTGENRRCPRIEHDEIAPFPDLD